MMIDQIVLLVRTNGHGGMLTPVEIFLQRVAIDPIDAERPFDAQRPTQKIFSDTAPLTRPPSAP